MNSDFTPVDSAHKAVLDQWDVIVSDPERKYDAPMEYMNRLLHQLNVEHNTYRRALNERS